MSDVGWDVLPFEMVSKIAEFLDMYSLSNLVLTCKVNKELCYVDDLWKFYYGCIPYRPVLIKTPNSHHIPVCTWGSCSGVGPQWWDRDSEIRDDCLIERCTNSYHWSNLIGPKPVDKNFHAACVERYRKYLTSLTKSSRYNT
tara:strand:+ start:431 stop:856 length:426 start_codon:yes stop_codon:yes gene_type:complete